jgi:hypothetical protein
MQSKPKTYNALIISLTLHTILMIWFSFYIDENAEEFQDLITVVLFSAERLPEPKVRKPHLLPKIDPPTPRVRQTVSRTGQTPKEVVEFSELTPAAAIQKDRVVSPIAPIEADAVPDFVTNADIPLTQELSVPDTSLGRESHATSPSQYGVRRGSGAEGKGIGKLEHRGENLSKKFAELMSESETVDKSPMTEPIEIPQGLGIFDTKVMPGHGLLGELYVPGEPLYFMPNFDALLPIYTFLATQLDISERAYTDGFPTPTNLYVVEDFALRFRGQIFINTTGRYDFALNADDGAQLFIDGLLVVDNDGIHPTQYRRGNMTLTRGLHAVEIRYFQGPRYHIAIQWFYKPPDGRERIVPPEMIYRPGRPRATRIRKRGGRQPLSDF